MGALLWAATAWAQTAPAGTCVDGVLVSSIRLEGLEYTKSHVVERELMNRVGAPFSAAKLETEKLKLQDLDLFTEIKVRCETLTPDSSTSGGRTSGFSNAESMALVYSFQEIFRWIPSPDYKPTDRDGILIGLALVDMNVAGEDIRAELRYRTALNKFFKNNEYAFYASSPYLFGLPLVWNFDFVRDDRWDELSDFRYASWLADLDVNWSMLPHFSMLATGAYRYVEGGYGILPEFGAGFALDYRDTKIDTRRGVYYEYMMTHVGAGKKSNGKGENYWELMSDARAYVPFGRFITGATALFRYRPGTVEFYDYYYHGGVNTFRGYDEPDENHIGTHELLLTLEERFVLVDRKAFSIAGVNLFCGLQLVAGVDGSLLWDQGRPGWEDYEGAVYGGIHLILPALDRVRLGVGYSPDKGEPVLLFGLSDKPTAARWRGR